MNKITQSELKSFLRYEQHTGNFFWVDDVSVNAKPGQMAGCITSRGYVHIRVGGKIFKAHRLAWLYVHGYLPENEIDHRNKIRNDNRISNLREVSRACNSRNTCNYKSNSSGVKGVAWIARDKIWQAHIQHNGKVYHLGNYQDMGEAVCARLAAEQCLGWLGCDSRSPAYMYVKKNIQHGK